MSHKDPRPEVPIFDEKQRPRSNGKIRENPLTGKISWLDPVSNQWKDAVRLDTIRGKLINDASAGGRQYKFKKHGNKDGEDPLNVTSFLPKDESYGYTRNDRPDILFTLFEPKDRRAEKPTTYMMDENRVCLDPFLHGIRDFAELPKTISSEVDGQDIEYWLRQNAEITRYDIMARTPSTYTVKGKVRNDPPHLNALTQRARRFREKAGCLSWEKNAGTANRNNYLLSILPEECKKPRVNSTRSVAQDLDDQQRKVELASVNRGQFQNKRRKSNRTPEAEVNNQSEERKLIPAELSFGIQHSEAANGNQSSPEQRLTIMTTRKRSYASTGNPNAAGQSAPPTTNDSHSNPRKRRIQEASRDHDSEYEVQHLPSAKRQKAAIGADVSDDNGVLERPGVIPARRSSRRITSTARSSYLSVEDEEDTSASESDTEETHISRGRKVQSTGSANQPSLEEGETEIQAPPSKVSGPIVGVLAQYVIEIDSDDEPMYDEQFQTETAATLAKTKDYRFITPIGRATDSRDRAYIRRALELTCIDFCDRRGHAVPNDLLTEHHNESYMSQQRHIQKEFSRIWCGADAAPSLYCLNAWTAGFSQWRVRSGKGSNLMAKLLKGEKMTAKLAKDD